MQHFNLRFRSCRERKPKKIKFPIETEEAFWLDSTDSNAYNLKACALETGEDAYIAKAMVNNQEATGLATRNASEAYIPYGSREHVVSNFQVLSTKAPANFIWLPGRNGNSPEAAGLGGIDDGVQMTIGRTCTPLTEGKDSFSRVHLLLSRFVQDEGRRPGKVHPVYRHLYITYNGGEYTYNTYEILCYKVSPGSLKAICQWKILTTLHKHKQTSSAIDKLSLPALLKHYLKEAF